MAQFPNVKLTTSELESDFPTYVSQAINRKTQTREIGGHRWRFSANFVRMTQDEMRPVFAFAMTLRGRSKSFEIIPPDLATPSGNQGLSHSVVSLVDNNTVRVGGFAPNDPDAVGIGDIFKFQNTSKVHMITDSAGSDGAGECEFSFEPTIFSDPSAGETVQFHNVPFTMMFAGNIQRYSVEPPLIYSYSVDLIEVL